MESCHPSLNELSWHLDNTCKVLPLLAVRGHSHQKPTTDPQKMCLLLKWDWIKIYQNMFCSRISIVLKNNMLWTKNCWSLQMRFVWKYNNRIYRVNYIHLKSLVILAIWLALIGANHSQIPPLFALNCIFSPADMNF